jgi:hypothetical protein
MRNNPLDPGKLHFNSQDIYKRPASLSDGPSKKEEGSGREERRD